MSTRAARTARGTVFAVVATLLAATAHTLGGGGAPSPLFCAVVAVLALPFAVALAGARVNAWRTWAAVGASQLVFHVAFAVAGDTAPSAADMASMAPGHVHGLAQLPDATPVASSPQLSMIVFHAAAAVVTALAVRRGEALLASLARWTRRVLPRVRVFVPRPAVRPMPFFVTAPRPRRARVLAHPLSRRGPPAALTV